MKRVSIGIQARSTSSRLPNKIMEIIGDKTILDHVLTACQDCADYTNSFSYNNKISCSTHILIPKGDPVRDYLKGISTDDLFFLEGSETDVLSRYVDLANKTNADYIVRITSDCPLIPHFLIYKCINTAVKNSFDYFSNVGDLDELSARTAIDGYDVEVLSKRALLWANVNAKGKHREHVTTILRCKEIPPSFKKGILVGHLDQSDIKLSIDTAEDLEKARAEYEKIQTKLYIARKRFGKGSVHRS